MKRASLEVPYIVSHVYSKTNNVTDVPMRKKENKIAMRLFTVLELVSFSNMESASTVCVTRMSNTFQEEKRKLFLKIALLTTINRIILPEVG